MCQKSAVFLMLVGSVSGYAQNDLRYYTNLARKNSPLIKDNQNQDKVNQAEIQRLKALYKATGGRYSKLPYSPHTL
jgi:hypothetical protein